MSPRARGRKHLLVATGLLAFCAIASVPSRAQDAAPSQPTLTLKQAVALAQQNSPDLKVARLQYNVAQREAGVDRANFLPNLYTGSGAAYTNGFPSLPGGNAPALFQLDYTQTLFNPALRAQQHADEQRAKSLKLEADRIQADVIARTATTYLELAKVRHSLELLRNEQASAEKIIDVVRQRIAANQELPIEETRSQLALAQVHERTVKLENRNDVLGEQLRDLAGLSDQAPLQLEQTSPSLANDLANESDTQIVAFALQSDQTIAEAENDRIAKEQLLRGAKLSRFPTIDLVGQYSLLSKFNNYDQFYKNFQRNNVNVGVQIQIPLFSAKTNANIALAQSQLRASEAVLETKRGEVRGDVEGKQRDLREVAATRETARLALQLAQETFTLDQSRLQQGQMTLGDVAQAQLDQNERWIDFLDADFAQQKAQIGVLQATGQLAKVFQ